MGLGCATVMRRMPVAPTTIVGQGRSNLGTVKIGVRHVLVVVPAAEKNTPSTSSEATTMVELLRRDHVHVHVRVI